jgi:hypothetical protein
MRAYAFRELQLPRGPWVGLFLGLFVALPLALHADPQHSVMIHFLVWAGFALTLLLMGRLCIEVDSQELRWFFGWFGWPGGRVRLADITRVEMAAMRWSEGWGIRRTREGMLYNLSGRQTVSIVCGNGEHLRLGSQDPARLIAAISARLPHQARPAAPSA